jgi:putative oxidoreductase
MNYIQRIGHWGDVHHPKWIDIIRMGLGAFLFYKGIDFIQNMSTMIAMMANKTPFGTFGVVMLGQYVAYVHLVGGLLLIFGLCTRIASLLQIPILVGAIIFINNSGGMFRPYAEMFVSVLVLLLLVYFLIAGNGPWSFKIHNEDEGKAGSED